MKAKTATCFGWYFCPLCCVHYLFIWCRKCIQKSQLEILISKFNKNGSVNDLLVVYTSPLHYTGKDACMLLYFLQYLLNISKISKHNHQRCTNIHQTKLNKSLCRWCVTILTGPSVVPKVIISYIQLFRWLVKIYFHTPCMCEWNVTAPAP